MYLLVSWSLNADPKNKKKVRSVKQKEKKKCLKKKLSSTGFEEEIDQIFLVITWTEIRRLNYSANGTDTISSRILNKYWQNLNVRTQGPLRTINPWKSSAKRWSQHFHAFGADDQRGKSAFFIWKIKIFDRKNTIFTTETLKNLSGFTQRLYLKRREKKSDGKYECVDHE